MRLRGNPSAKAIAAALLAGRLHVKSLGGGEIILATAKDMQAARERTEDLVLALGGAIEEYDALGRLVQTKGVRKFGWQGQLLQTAEDVERGRRPPPLRVRSRELVGSALAVDGPAAFRLFRRQWGAVLPAVTLADLQALQRFCRRCGISAARRPDLGDHARRVIAQRAREDRVGLLYRALAAHVRLTWPRCRFCKKPFIPRGTVEDCCGAPACRRLRERERWRRRYRTPEVKEQTKQRVARWRQRQREAARRTMRSVRR
jgi:hypothetical protein